MELTFHFPKKLVPVEMGCVFPKELNFAHRKFRVPLETICVYARFMAKVLPIYYVSLEMRHTISDGTFVFTLKMFHVSTGNEMHINILNKNSHLKSRKFHSSIGKLCVYAFPMELSFSDHRKIQSSTGNEVCVCHVYGESNTCVSIPHPIANRKSYNRKLNKRIIIRSFSIIFNYPTSENNNK